MAVTKGILAIIIILVIALGSVSTYAVLIGTKSASGPTTTSVSSAGIFNTTVVNQCQAEGGSITLYSFFSPTNVFPAINSSVVGAFPWFKINYVQLQFGDVASRALTEYQAGHVVADSIVDTRSDLEILHNASALQAWLNPNIAIMNWSGSDQYQTSFYYDPPLLIWNTNKITNNASLPTTWQELASPQWKGEVAFDDPSTLNTAGPLFSSLEASMGNASWTAFMKSLAANDPIITQGTSVSYTDVSTGQAEIGIALIDDVEGGLASHPPVGYKYIDPTYGDPASIAILKNAPHPACAELFELYMTSYAGAVALAKGGTPSGISLVNLNYLPFWPYPANATILPAGPSTLYSNPTAWVNTFTGIFGP